MNILGMYILVSLGFVACAMIEFAFVLLLNRRAMLKMNDKQDSSRVENNSKKHLKKLKLKTKVIAIHNGNLKGGCKTQASTLPLHKFDLIAFCAHSAAYVIFNTWYWKEYFN